LVFFLAYIGKNYLSLHHQNCNHYKIIIKNRITMETKEKVLQVMREAGEPLNAGKIAEISGLDRKEVDKAMKQLKEEGAIVSPVRCKWAPAQ
jgi:biotin operon repressor